MGGARQGCLEPGAWDLPAQQCRSAPRWLAALAGCGWLVANFSWLAATGNQKCSGRQPTQPMRAPHVAPLLWWRGLLCDATRFIAKSVKPDQQRNKLLPGLAQHSKKEEAGTF